MPKQARRCARGGELVREKCVPIEDDFPTASALATVSAAWGTPTLSGRIGDTRGAETRPVDLRPKS